VVGTLGQQETLAGRHEIPVTIALLCAAQDLMNDAQRKRSDKLIAELMPANE
jgi:hypothetical protein